MYFILMLVRQHTESVFALKAGSRGESTAESQAGGGLWNHTVLTGAGDKTAIVWDLRSGEQ